METSKSKPDLMAAAPTARGTVQGKRILAQLEHGVKPASAVGPAHAAGWTIDGWTISLVVLLLLMCSVAWMMHGKRITPETFRHGYSDAGPARGVANHNNSSRSSSAVAPQQTSFPPTDSDTVVEAAAAIVNVGVPAAVELPSSLARAEATTAMANAATVATAARTTIAQSPRTAAAAAAQRKPSTPAPRATAMAGPATTPTSGDTDITLLTALVAHASKPATVTPERSRDIVERQDGDSTAQLLARCKQLGLIEGMLCRSRICSGRWEGDAACRAPSH